MNSQLALKVISVVEPRCIPSVPPVGQELTDPCAATMRGLIPIYIPENDSAVVCLLDAEVAPHMPITVRLTEALLEDVT